MYVDTEDSVQIDDENVSNLINGRKRPMLMKKKTISAQKFQMFKAINAVSGSLDMDPDLILTNNDLYGLVDGQGNTIRWQRMPMVHDANFGKGKCLKRGERIYTDQEAVDLISQLNEELYERLEARRKAISNWKRLKIVIVILKMSGGRVDDSQDVKKQEEVTRQ